MEMPSKRSWLLTLFTGLFVASFSVARAQIPTFNTLYAFSALSNPQDNTDGALPAASLLQGSDGNFYGTTTTGGAYAYGTVFKMTPAGAVTLLHSFNGADGWSPQANVVQGSDGNYYGTTTAGGSGGNGTVFKVSPVGAFTLLYSFSAGTAVPNSDRVINSDGAYPRAALTQGPDGSFYGATRTGGANGYGTLFKISSTGTLTTLTVFGASTTDGQRPEAALTLASDGSFYGTTTVGGTNGNGTVFKLSASGVLTYLYSFSAFTGNNGGWPTNTEGAYPQAPLTLGTDGSYYSVTAGGGVNGYGTVYKITPSGTLTSLHTIQVGEGVQIRARLALGSDGNFYGTTPNGGANSEGAVYKITPTGTLTILYSFSYSNTNTNPDGMYPNALILGSDGKFYGTTNWGGAYGNGTVFKITSAGALTTLHAFTAFLPLHNDKGAAPNGPLLQARDGNFYGTTASGGANGTGTIFRMAPDGTLSPLYTFSAQNPATGANADGAVPNGGLVQGTDGSLYGTAYQGGAQNEGTVFKITTSGVFTTLHAFWFENPNAIEGENPEAGLIQAADGNFYGTTYFGGDKTYGGGTIFKITPDGVFTTFYGFMVSDPNGQNPTAPLLQGADGSFYGTTQNGGQNGEGNVFKITPDGVINNLYSFDTYFKPGDGAYPTAGVIQGSDGNFYGTTTGGGANNTGTVFQLTPDGALTILHSFGSLNATSYTNADGANPYASLLQGRDGNLYGLTKFGGPHDTGTAFRITPTGTFSLVHPFAAYTPPYADGEHPVAGLIQANDGRLYGVALSGGPNGSGIIFRIKITYPFDLNRDGHSDLLFQNQTTGDVVYALMNGSTATKWGYLFKSMDAHWQIVGTPDLNGDGHPDILWQNQITGDVVYTLMNGTSQLAWGKLFTKIDPHWQVVGTPDLNGDGWPDILWQNMATGAVVYTLMQGTTQITWGNLFAGIDPHDRIVGTPDINGDSYPDILWENTTTGEIVATAMQGVTSLGWSKLFTISPSFRINALADLNSDGYFDFLYQDQALGKVVTSFMVGPDATSWSNLFLGMDPNWRLVAPR